MLQIQECDHVVPMLIEILQIEDGRHFVTSLAREFAAVGHTAHYTRPLLRCAVIPHVLAMCRLRAVAMLCSLEQLNYIWLQKPTAFRLEG
jgi:hypothetical protein